MGENRVVLPTFKGDGRQPGVTLEDTAEARFWQGVQTAGRFFMGEADVHKALENWRSCSTPTGFPTPSSGPWPSMSSATSEPHPMLVYC